MGVTKLCLFFVLLAGAGSVAGHVGGGWGGGGWWPAGTMWSRWYKTDTRIPVACTGRKILAFYEIRQKSCITTVYQYGQRVQCGCRTRLNNGTLYEEIMRNCSGKASCNMRVLKTDMSSKDNCRYHGNANEEFELDVLYFCAPTSRVKTICDDYTGELTNRHSEAFITSVGYLTNETHLAHLTPCMCRVTVPQNSELDIYALDVHLGRNSTSGSGVRGQCDETQQVILETPQTKLVLKCNDWYDVNVLNSSLSGYVKEVNITFHNGRTPGGRASSYDEKRERGDARV